MIPWAAYDDWDDRPTDCLTHRCFIPCRRDDGCQHSTDPVDVARVPHHQQDRNAALNSQRGEWRTA